MIYDNIVKREHSIKDIPQIIEDVSTYERFFKVEQDDVIVDIGAHVGMFFTAHLEKASRVIAVEPDPMFNKSYPVNDKLTVFKAGISYKNGKSFITSNGEANAIGSGNTEISTVTFKDLTSEVNKIDFLKVDCEGGEYDIFTKDNIEWIKNNVRKIAGEFHIHNEEHKLLLPFVLLLFKNNNIPFILASIDGVILSEKQVLDNLNYYKEIFFYATPNYEIESDLAFSYNYVDGCRVDIQSGTGYYDVLFLNQNTNEVLYESSICAGQFSKCNFSYFIPYKIIIKKQNTILYEVPFNLKGSRVLISLDSKSLGDTLAWIPYIEEFRKKHQCEVVCSTFINSLFTETYENLQFVEPNVIVHGIVAKYNIGWFYNGDEIDSFKNPTDPKVQPMQKTASDILGLEFVEIKPKLKLPVVEKEDTISIGIHATAQSKYWNNEKGWQDVVDYINSINYTPLLVSKESDGYMGNKHPENIQQLEPGDLQALMVAICKSKLFIGVGSGLSWLAWACDVPVILISGFSYHFTEMKDCRRISTPLGKCSGCFNTHKLNQSDWNWCPENKGTNKQFECTKSITSDIVIKNIKEILDFC